MPNGCRKATKVFPGGGMVVTVTLRVTVTDEVSYVQVPPYQAVGSAPRGEIFVFFLYFFPH